MIYGEQNLLAIRANIWYYLINAAATPQKIRRAATPPPWPRVRKERKGEITALTCGAAVWRPAAELAQESFAQSEEARAEAALPKSGKMADLKLVNIKKIYPAGPEEKKKHKKQDAEPEKKVNLQITDEGVVAVQEFSLDVEDKEFVVLVGPSGCGKSTTLRMIAGLEEITGGELYIGGKLMNDVAPKDRDIAMVFQNYALYPHMTVYDNMAFSLKLRKAPREEIDRKVREAAEILGITEYLNRKPKALSGGQRQRVAIGRAIVREPSVFLMDEPLSNLDAKLRNQMRAELIKLRQKVNTTFIYVTHDQTEAMTLGDRIVIMKDGFIQQIGTPQEVYNHPANLFVAGFIGTPQMNFFENAKLLCSGKKYSIELAGHAIELPEEKCAALAAAGAKEGKVSLGVRPEHMELAKRGAGLSSTLDVSEMMGSQIHLHVTLDSQDVVLILSTMDLPEEHKQGFHFGDEISFTFDGGICHLFDPETGKNLI